jgi:hypothetical protein
MDSMRRETENLRPFSLFILELYKGLNQRKHITGEKERKIGEWR